MSKGQETASHRASESCDCQPCRDVKALAAQLTAAQWEIARLQWILNGIGAEMQIRPPYDYALLGEAAIADVRRAARAEQAEAERERLRSAMLAEMSRLMQPEAGTGRYLPADETWNRLLAFVRGSDSISTPARPTEEPKVQHMKRGDSTACGAARERGNSYYEWAYVNCPACLATRPSEETQG